MSIFAKKITPEDLSYRLGELAAEVRELKSAHKHLELEWEELYDKVRHQMARMSRRVKVDTKDELNDAEPEAMDRPTPGSDPISRSILLRRGTLGAKQ